MKVVRKQLVVTLILVAGVFSQWALPSVNAQDGDLFPDKEVQIINRTGLTISFSLKLTKTGWVGYSLAPGASRLYKNVEQIFVQSQNGQRCYALERNKRYAIQWNSGPSLYDVYKLSKK
jgi:hypothetical protein